MGGSYRSGSRAAGGAPASSAFGVAAAVVAGAAVAAVAGVAALFYVAKQRAARGGNTVVEDGSDMFSTATPVAGHVAPATLLRDATTNVMPTSATAAPHRGDLVVSTRLDEAQRWAERGAALGADEGAYFVAESGERLSRVQCYTTALSLDPRCALAWYKLGACCCGTVKLPFAIEGATIDGSGDTLTSSLTDADCIRLAIECYLTAQQQQQQQQGTEAVTIGLIQAEPPRGWALADAWFNLAVATRWHHRSTKTFEGVDGDGEEDEDEDDSGSNARVSVAGVEYSVDDMYRAALQLDPVDGEKWLSVARAIDDDDDTDGNRPTRVSLRFDTPRAIAVLPLSAAATTQSAPAGVVVISSSAREMYVFAAELADANEADAWYDLAASLGALRADRGRPSQSIPSRVALSVLQRGTVQATDPPLPLRHVNLPTGTPRRGDASVAASPTRDGHDVKWGVSECLVASLLINPANPRAWTDLAREMLNNSAVESTAALSVHPVDCIAMALELNPADGDSWTCLASCVEAGKARTASSFAVVRGRHVAEWSASGCLVESLLLNRDSADAWFNVAVMHPKGFALPKDRVLLGRHGGAVFTQAECYGAALTLRPAWPRGWAFLGESLLLTTGALSQPSAMVDGRKYTAKDCFVESVRLGGGTQASVWRGLAATLGPDEVVTIPATSAVQRRGPHGSPVAEVQTLGRVQCVEMAEALELNS